MAVVLEILQPTQESAVVDKSSVVVEVLMATVSPRETINGVAVVDTIAPGGTVANVGWGYDFPLSPVEGQIFIKVTPP
jgi:hypothetical protein